MIELMKELAEFAVMFAVGWLTFEIYAVAQVARGSRKTEQDIERKYGKTY